MRRQSVQSSFDLFLDTVCNTFGGILFIAILIAIQIRQVEAPPVEESCSLERIEELLQRSEELTDIIRNATLLLETIRKTLPEPVDENDRNLVATYSELLDNKNALIAKKSELTRDCLAQAKENADLERDLKIIEEKLEQLEIEESRLAETVRGLQGKQRDLQRKATDAKNLVSELETEVAQKSDKVQDQHDPDKNTRKEELYLPKMEDSGNLRPFYLVLRFNRLYVVERREDFDYQGNRLGTPKRNRGLFVDDTDAVRRSIENLVRSLSPSQHYVAIFVYGDSVDSFYVIRDILIAKDFRYELIPSPDDTPWASGSGAGSTNVQ